MRALSIATDTTDECIEPLTFRSVENGSHLCDDNDDIAQWLFVKRWYGRVSCLSYYLLRNNSVFVEIQQCHLLKNKKVAFDFMFLTVLDYKVSVLFNGPTLAMEEKIYGQGCA